MTLAVEQTFGFRRDLYRIKRIEERSQQPPPQDVIIVPGHAVFRNTVRGVPFDPWDERNWVLTEFQKGEVPFYIQHILRAIELAKENKNALLVFSGGVTRPESSWSEADTYLQVAQQVGRRRNRDEDSVKFDDLMKHRTYGDVNAYDSFQNLLGGLCTFNIVTGNSPGHVTVVGWEFKRERYGMHREALGYPADRFNYIGVNNPEKLQDALEGEARAVTLFQQNPYGNAGPLFEKRVARNGSGGTRAYADLVRNPDIINYLHAIDTPGNNHAPPVDWSRKGQSLPWPGHPPNNVSVYSSR